MMAQDGAFPVWSAKLTPRQVEQSSGRGVLTEESGDGSGFLFLFLADEGCFIE